MARNKYPEETQNLILNTAQKLFINKGYDSTSIQDIINNLGGLSKGAIYHHFKSKEEILFSVMNRWNETVTNYLKEILKDDKLNGYEKLRALFKRSLYISDKDIAYLAAPDFRKNPQMLVMQLESALDEVVPDFILPVLEEGMADGSIQTEYPKELAEVLALLANIWLNPLISCGADLEEMMRRVRFFDVLTRKFGLVLVDQEMMDKFQQLGDGFYAGKAARNNHGTMR